MVDSLKKNRTVQVIYTKGRKFHELSLNLRPGTAIMLLSKGVEVMSMQTFAYRLF